MLNGTTSQPVQGPMCVAYAPLLPVLDDLTDTRLAEDTRDHLSGCAWCRAQRASYDRFDEALRAHFAPDAMPILSENLAASLLGDVSDEPATLPAPDEEFVWEEDDDALDITITPLPLEPRPPNPPRRSWRLTAIATSLAAMLVISLLSGLLLLSHERLTPPASPRATAQTQVATPAPPIPDTRVPLAAIGMSSPTDGWAFAEGSAEINGVQTTALHYTGSHWVEAHDKLNGDIQAVKMLSPTDGWAVGSGVFHYDGKRWQQVDMGNLGDLGAFQAIAVVSPTDIWLAGTGHTSQPLIVHYDGHTWTQQRPPYFPDANVVSVTGIAMVSATEGWAVVTNSYVPDCTNSYNNNCGVNEDTTSVVLHYDNGAWQVALTLPKYNLSSISMVSAHEGWLGGEKQVRNTTFPAIGSSAFSGKPTLWHYTGSHWVEVSPPQPAAESAVPVGQIKNITMFSATEGWLFASLFDQSQTSDGAVRLSPDVFHLEQGQWVEVKTPAIKNRVGVSMLQVSFVAPDEFWGVGESMAPNATDSTIIAAAPLIVHYKGGVWSVIES